jgi:hypothetical protein
LLAGFGTAFAAVPDLLLMLKRRSSKGFTEGSDTPVLQEAKALLDGLL